MATWRTHPAEYAAWWAVERALTEPMRART